MVALTTFARSFFSLQRIQRCFRGFLQPLFLGGAVGFLLVSSAVSAQEPLRLMVFGDSLTHGYGLSAGEPFPDQLEVALQARDQEVTVINSGNSGDTTASGRSRLEWALADKPHAVIVELGANDGLRGLEPSQTYENLDAIVARFKQDGIPVLLAGMLAPRNLGQEYVDEFDSVYPRLAEKHDVALYPFFLEGVALNRDLNQADGTHPNKEGVAVIVSKILPHVEELLVKARQTEMRHGG